MKFSLNFNFPFQYPFLYICNHVLLKKLRVFFLCYFYKGVIKIKIKIRINRNNKIKFKLHFGKITDQYFEVNCKNSFFILI
jgi:hypothetical protein